MTLLIDNYDSFSYNLYQLIGSISPEIQVIRNDAWDLSRIEAFNPDRIILSPGPGYPKDAGICEEVVQNLGTKFPLLGVCLGHQAICEAFGGTIVHAKKLMHGKQSKALLDGSCPLFQGLPEEILVARYHSLAADAATLPSCLKVVAETSDHEVMAVQHEHLPIYGLQFHPESILTPEGTTLLQNFLNIH